MSIRLSAPLLFVVAVGCSSLSSAPTRVEFLNSGYLVDGTVLESSADLQAYLRARGIRAVRLVPSVTTPYARIEEAVVAVRHVGATLGVVGTAAVGQ